MPLVFLLTLLSGTFALFFTLPLVALAFFLTLLLVSLAFFLAFPLVTLRPFSISFHATLRCSNDLRSPGGYSAMGSPDPRDGPAPYPPVTALMRYLETVPRGAA